MISVEIIPLNDINLKANLISVWDQTAKRYLLKKNDFRKKLLQQKKFDLVVNLLIEWIKSVITKMSFWSISLIIVDKLLNVYWR